MTQGEWAVYDAMTWCGREDDNSKQQEWALVDGTAVQR
jgi:hypothetical protein